MTRLLSLYTNTLVPPTMAMMPMKHRSTTMMHFLLSRLSLPNWFVLGPRWIMILGAYFLFIPITFMYVTLYLALYVFRQKVYDLLLRDYRNGIEIVKFNMYYSQYYQKTISPLKNLNMSLQELFITMQDIIYYDINPSSKEMVVWPKTPDEIRKNQQRLVDERRSTERQIQFCMEDLAKLNKDTYLYG